MNYLRHDELYQVNAAHEVGLVDTWELAYNQLGELGFRDEHGADVAATLDGFRDYGDLVSITRWLVARGSSDGAIAGILRENFLRISEAVVG